MAEGKLTEERKAAERLTFKFLCLLLVIFALIWIVPMVWRMLSPFIVAIPLAALLQPLISFLQKKLKFKRGIATLLLVLVLTAVVLSILIWLFTFGIGMVFGFTRYIFRSVKLPGIALCHGLYDFLNHVVRMFVI